MSLLSKICFGTPGTGELFGVKITFDSKNSWINVFDDTLFSKSANFILTNSTLKFLTLGYLHVFIHEMGHALAAKFRGASHVQIKIFTQTCRGYCEISEREKFNLFVKLAGPGLATLFEFVKLIAGIAIMTFLSLPVGFAVGGFLSFGSIVWIIGETAYAFSGKEDWDFSN